MTAHNKLLFVINTFGALRARYLCDGGQEEGALGASLFLLHM